MAWNYANHREYYDRRKEVNNLKQEKIRLLKLNIKHTSNPAILDKLTKELAQLES